MEDYKKYQIPAFGYWDFSDDLPITQYFESARHAGLLRYSAGDGERDLYGDDFKMANVNVMMTTAAVSHPKIKRSLKPCQEEHVKEQKKLGRVCDMTEEPRRTRAPKAVDEDLYKIPPELLHEKPKRSKMLGFLSRCLVLSCIS
ncbi:hypothetical protein AAC387_Pa08g2617 [Persea americana]|eukprot:TRINITY_DN42663_c0_g1_i1.p1 TRINITY_DN42663_c0_g1~~TRINITY_DN42663_c0_g1_i1.p1  ORF type:complete len:144 (+),score=26.47 TRINITY_DN42663_c0_g1_i1:354-785(+)